MDDIQLIRYANVPDAIAKVKVVEATNANKDKYTKYADEKEARKVYSDDEIRNRIKRWILSENLVVLTGAGTSITTAEAGESLDENKSKFTGKSVWHIWQKCKEILEAEDVAALQKELREPEEEFQLERFISKIEIFVSANGESENADLKALVETCITVRDIIISTLKEECDLLLHKTAPHPKFLRDILAARRDKTRLQLYTLNYDTLFEQGAEKLSATVIDGFAFSRNPYFNGSNFDLDVVKRAKNRIQHNENYEEKVFQLYKLHGSLDWRKDDASDKIVRVQDILDKRDTIFIPPSINKFERSYDMPYFEMMSRFQQSLRRENTTLIVIGYSFSDNHINRVIHEALNSNLNFELIVISPTVGKADAKGSVGELHQLLENGQNNITLISDTFQRFTQHMPAIVSDDEEPHAGKIDVEINERGEEEEIADAITF